MRFRKVFISSLIVVIGGTTAAFAQSSNSSSDVIDDSEPVLVELLQGQDKPQVPGSWSVSILGGNYLGVSTENLDSQNLGTYGVHDARGVGVKQVIKDSPAEKAGLQKGDVILRFDNEAVTSTTKLTRLISEAESGHTAQLTISRNGAEQQLSVKLGERSENRTGLFRTEPGNAEGLVRGFQDFGNLRPDPEAMNKLFRVFGAGRRIGVSTSPLTKQLGEYFGARDGGVLVSSVSENGPAAKAGLKAGDVITQIDGNKIDNAGDLVRELARKKDGEVTLTIVRDKSPRTVKVTPESAPASEFKLMDLPHVGAIAMPDIAIPQLPEIKDLVVPKIDINPQIGVPNPLVPEIDIFPEVDQIWFLKI